MTLTLPWPPKELSPNSRTDRRYTGSIRRKYKDACWGLALEAKFKACSRIHITFHPPDRRRRDLDNMYGSIKYGIDGAMNAAGKDDYIFDDVRLTRGEPRPNGAVLIRSLDLDNALDHLGAPWANHGDDG